jgi:diaminopropionate ammonia-lyase
VWGSLVGMGTPTLTRSWFVRPAARSWTAGPRQTSDPRHFHQGLPGYAPTRLVELPALAEDLGVDRLFVKDESARFGLPAFKILGASWAIHQALSEHYDVEADSFDRLRDQIAGRPAVRLVTATDGNHGRAVARMAALLGLPAHVFVPEGVHPAARAAIEAEGATVTFVPGPYDDAVRVASESGGLLVQDTAWPGYERIPQWIVDGYSTLFAEIDDQLREAGAEPVGLVAVPVGVGSLAQAAVTHYRRGQATEPTLLAVEPETAAGVLTSLEHGSPVTVPPGSTIMAGLNCPTPSSLAWPYLRDGLDAAVTVTDQDAAAAAADLAALGVPAGPCGAASLAGARAALTGGPHAALTDGPHAELSRDRLAALAGGRGGALTDGLNDALTRDHRAAVTAGRGAVLTRDVHAALSGDRRGELDLRAGLAAHHARTVVLLSTEGAEANPALTVSGG